MAHSLHCRKIAVCTVNPQCSMPLHDPHINLTVIGTIKTGPAGKNVPTCKKIALTGVLNVKMVLIEIEVEGHTCLSAIVMYSIMSGTYQSHIVKCLCYKK